MEVRKKGVYSIVELPLVFLLTLGVFSLLFSFESSTLNQEPLVVESFLTAIINQDETKLVFINENLSQTPLSQNWTLISSYLNLSFSNYALKLSNNETSKQIYSCIPTYSKIVASRIVSITNNSDFEPRTITLEVCS